jgi:hypothetical protein
MKLISHRGNIYGPNLTLENTTPHIINAIINGFEVEIDVWKTSGGLFLGHDAPAHPITIDFLKNPLLWCHAKNAEALHYLVRNSVHCFWQESDEFSITSNGFIWGHSRLLKSPKSIKSTTIICCPEAKKNPLGKKVAGICSDYVAMYKTSRP